MGGGVAVAEASPSASPSPSPFLALLPASASAAAAAPARRASNPAAPLARYSPRAMSAAAGDGVSEAGRGGAAVLASPTPSLASLPAASSAWTGAREAAHPSADGVCVGRYASWATGAGDPWGAASPADARAARAAATARARVGGPHPAALMVASSPPAPLHASVQARASPGPPSTYSRRGIKARPRPKGAHSGPGAAAGSNRPATNRRTAGAAGLERKGAAPARAAGRMAGSAPGRQAATPPSWSASS